MEHRFRVDELRDIFGPLVLPQTLPDRLAVQQAQGACQPIHGWDTPGAREACTAFNGVLARVLRTRTRRWSRTEDGYGDEDRTAG
jgi:hypothetical protein